MTPADCPARFLPNASDVVHGRPVRLPAARNHTERRTSQFDRCPGETRAYKKGKPGRVQPEHGGSGCLPGPPSKKFTFDEFAGAATSSTFFSSRWGPGGWIAASVAGYLRVRAVPPALTRRGTAPSLRCYDACSALRPRRQSGHRVDALLPVADGVPTPFKKTGRSQAPISRRKEASLCVPNRGPQASTSSP